MKRTTDRRRTVVAFVLTGSFATLAADRSVGQDERPDAAEVRAAVTGWIGSDHSDRELLDRAVAAVLDAGDRGPRLLAGLAREVKPDQRDRRRGLDALIVNVGVGFLQRQVESGLVYAGQYDPLLVLQPRIGRFYLSLVLDTPDWFPENMRALAVPALRDLYPKGPDEASLERLRDTAEDNEFESDALRLALSLALAQWGHRDLVEGRLEELREAAGEGETADELHFVRELAGFHHQLREYERAADLWSRFIEGTGALGDAPGALDEYNAACCLALAGRIEPALDAVERCASRIASGRAASSVELTRKMFQTDPELRALRSTKRFQAAVDRAFAKKEAGARR